MKEHELHVFVNKVVRKIFRPKDNRVSEAIQEIARRDTLRPAVNIFEIVNAEAYNNKQDM
jgi:hypothetical protein